MSNISPTDSSRWEELQIARMLFGLTTDEEAELDELSRKLPADEADEFEAVVAALDIAWSEKQVLPAHLRQQVRLRAQQEIGLKSVVSLAPPQGGNELAKRAGRYLPWLLSAACMMISFFSWAANRPSDNPVPNDRQLRAKMLASQEGLVRATWTAGTTPVGKVDGDVVWSPAQQAGFMRFRGLPVNLPTR